MAVLAGGSGLDPAALYRLTGGNPFYVSQAVQAGMSEVPESARDAVLARAARLEAPTRRAAATRAAKLGLIKTAPLAAAELPARVVAPAARGR